MEQEIDLAIQANLEKYAKSESITLDLVQSWISVGMLSPKETGGALKLIKMLRSRDGSQKLCQS